MAELDEDESPDDGAVEATIEQFPILGLPMSGAVLTPAAVLGLLFYPFAEDILPENGQTIEGVETADQGGIGFTKRTGLVFAQTHL